MNQIKKYGVHLDLEDSQGWKWGKHIALWAFTIGSAQRAGRLYMDHINAGDNGEKVTGYRAFEMVEG
jgi:hypothetical protein